MTAITAIFAPLTLITGVFGMNFDHMPLINNIHGFGWTLIGMGLVAAIVLVIFWTRRFLDAPTSPENTALAAIAKQQAAVASPLQSSADSQRGRQ